MQSKKFGKSLIMIGIVVTVISSVAFFVNNPSAARINLDDAYNRLGVTLGSDYRRNVASDYATRRMISGVFVVVGLIMTGIGVATKSSTAKSKKCPYCAESIKAEARVCRYCGGDLLDRDLVDAEVEKHLDRLKEKIRNS